MIDEPTGKPCPNCGEPMARLRGRSEMMCATGCKQAVPWELDEGQKSLIGNNRQDRRSKQE